MEAEMKQTKKTKLDELVEELSGAVEIAVPRDRNGSFEPRFVRKH